MIYADMMDIEEFFLDPWRVVCAGFLLLDFLVVLLGVRSAEPHCPG